MAVGGVGGHGRAGAARRTSGGRERPAAAQGRTGGHGRSWMRGWDCWDRSVGRVVRPDVCIFVASMAFGSETVEMVPYVSILPRLMLLSVRTS